MKDPGNADIVFDAGHMTVKRKPGNQLQVILEIYFQVFPHIIERHLIVYKCKQGLKILFQSNIISVWASALLICSLQIICNYVPASRPSAQEKKLAHG